jgi:UDP-N-acetylglucosamine acyltransferase
MAYAHVAHDCHVGDRVILANAVQLAGFVTVEDWAIIGGISAVHQFCRVGCHAMLGGGARFIQDVAPYAIVGGTPPRPTGINVIGLERRGIPRETRVALDRAFRTLFRRKLTVTAAVSAMRAEHPGVPEVEHLARFAETTIRTRVRRAGRSRVRGGVRPPRRSWGGGCGAVRRPGFRHGRGAAEGM